MVASEGDVSPCEKGLWMSANRLVWLAAVICGGAMAASGAAEGDPLSEAAIEGRIRRHRTASVTLTVTDGGKPLANATVTVGMTRHRFLFGSNIFPLMDHLDRESYGFYRKRFADLLNFATLPFYWHMYEGKEGRTQQARVMRVATWCEQRGIRTKGHPLAWTLEPRWLRDKDAAVGDRLLTERIVREVKAFRGVIDTWDVINEVVVGPEQAKQRGATAMLRRYERDGRLKVVQDVFALARRTNPNASLILNDFDTSAKFEKLIADTLKAGVSVDVVGIQSHMHDRYWGAKRTWDVCERFAKFGRPLHFTELTIISGPSRGYQGDRRAKDWNSTPEGEKRQAQQVRELYRILFSHPAVEAITWWDFTDRGAWQGAPAGLIRNDMSPKPAYDALMKLIKQDWWTAPQTLKTDATGKLTFQGFLGDYQVKANTRTATFTLDKPGTAKKQAALR